MDTNHDGTLGMLPSNGTRKAARRPPTLVAEAQPSFPFEDVVSVVDGVLRLEGGNRRRPADIGPGLRGGNGKKHGQ